MEMPGTLKVDKLANIWEFSDLEIDSIFPKASWIMQTSAAASPRHHFCYSKEQDAGWIRFPTLSDSGNLKIRDDGRIPPAS